MAECLISIGSNLGDRSQAIDLALAALQSHPAISLQRTSGRHATEPVGGPAGQGTFVNAAALVETSLPPFEVLRFLQELESRAGRARAVRWEARSLDLDLLLYDDLVLNDERLRLPHPRMAFRRFVLVPAAEIAPEMFHPLLGRNITQLLMHLEQAPDYVAVTGLQGAQKAKLVRSVATRVGATAIIEGPMIGLPAKNAGGPSVQLELEFLAGRCELLRGVTGSAQEPYAISDFWLGQSLAYASQLPLNDARRIELAWLKCRRQVVSPKLIAFVEVSIDEKHSDQQVRTNYAIQRHLTERLAEVGQPPVLRLNAAAPAWNEEEVAAAVLAMQ